MSPWTPTVLQWTTRRTPAAPAQRDQRTDGSRVHRAVDAVVEAGGAIERGDVVDDVDAIDGARERRGVGEIAGDELDPGQRRHGLPRIADQRPHAIASPRERPRQMAAREPGRAGDEDALPAARLGHHASSCPTGARSASSGHRRAEQPVETERHQRALGRAREAGRADGLVERDRQDEVAMPLAHAEAGGPAGLVDRGVAEHAVGLGRPAEAVEDATAHRLQRRGAGACWIVEDEAAASHAAQLGDTAAPVGHVHQQSEADRDVEAAVGERQVPGVAAEQADHRGGPGDACLPDAQHLARVVESGDACAAFGEGERGARRARADVEDLGAAHLAGERPHDEPLAFGHELADRAAEAERVEPRRDVRIRVVLDAVMGRLHATPRATWAAPLPKSSA